MKSTCEGCVLFSPGLKDLLPIITRCVFTRFALSGTCSRFYKKYRDKHFLNLMHYLCGGERMYVCLFELLFALFPHPEVTPLQLMQGSCRNSRQHVWWWEEWRVELSEWQKAKVIPRWPQLAIRIERRKKKGEAELFGSNFYLIGPKRVNVQLFYVSVDVFLHDFVLDSNQIVPRVCAIFGCMCTNTNGTFFTKLRWESYYDRTRIVQEMNHF